MKRVRFGYISHKNEQTFAEFVRKLDNAMVAPADQHRAAALSSHLRAAPFPLPTHLRTSPLHPSTSPSSCPPSPLQWLRAAEAMLWKGGDKKGDKPKLPKQPSGSLESARRAAGKREGFPNPNAPNAGKKEGRKGLRENSPRTQKSNRARVAPQPGG